MLLLQYVYPNIYLSFSLKPMCIYTNMIRQIPSKGAFISAALSSIGLFLAAFGGCAINYIVSIAGDQLISTVAMSNTSKYIKEHENINNISLEASYNTNNNCIQLIFNYYGGIQIKQMLVLMVASIRHILKPSISHDAFNILSSANDALISVQRNNTLHIISLADETINKNTNIKNLQHPMLSELIIYI